MAYLIIKRRRVPLMLCLCLVATRIPSTIISNLNKLYIVPHKNESHSNEWRYQSTNTRLFVGMRKDKINEHVSNFDKSINMHGNGFCFVWGS